LWQFKASNADEVADKSGEEKGDGTEGSGAIAEHVVD
jgi:hypothetical protein